MINFLANSNCATSSFVAIIIAVILGILLILIVRGIKIVPQTQAFIIERLGKYYKTWGTGVHFLWPFIDRVATDPNASYSSGKLTSPRVIGKVNLKEQVIDFDPQPVITKDNVTMQIDAVIYYQITDPKSYVYGVTNPLKALDTLNTTTLRNIIGSLDLDQSLTSRNVINEQMREILDEATDPWGIKVFRVEVKNIMPPHDIREAMEKQMRAERERREVILLAEGEAEAIVKINEATAKGLEMVKNVNVDKGVLTLKAYESLEKVANGQATKIIIPSEIQGLAGLAMSASEIVKEK